MKSTGRLWLLAVCLFGVGWFVHKHRSRRRNNCPVQFLHRRKLLRKMTDRMKEELQLTAASSTINYID